MQFILFLPPREDELLPNAGVEDAPKAGIELPKPGVDEAPNAGVEDKSEDDCVDPNTPVDVPPNMELPVGDPKGELLKGLGAKGLLAALFVCPKIDWVPNGLLEDCPNAGETK
ncbi:hypothetical protein ACLOJK_015801 [Asimina triloba]